ncbi:MAG: hypothetical protein WD226_09350 [Planctomycetota bacterium]
MQPLPLLGLAVLALTPAPLVAQAGCVIDSIAQPATETSLLSTFGAGLAQRPGFLFASSPSETNRLFSFNGGVATWSLLEVIQGPPSALQPSNLNFGACLAVAGSRLAVGAPYSSLLGLPNGVTFVYEQDGAGLLQPIALLAPPPGSPAVRFGAATAIDESLPATLYYVGAPGDSFSEGEAFVYQVDFVGHALIATLAASAPTPQQRFGSSLAALAGRLLVGAPGPASTPGSVYVFETSAGGVPVQRLFPSVLTPGQGFGEALAAEGDRLLVGAPADFVGVGGGYVFERDAAGQYLEAAHLAPQLPRWLDAAEFGTRVALRGDIAVLRGRTSAAAGLRPVIAVFEQIGGAWRQQKLITAGDLGFMPVDNLIGDVLLGDDRVIFATKDIGLQKRRLVEYRLPGAVRDLGGGVAGQTAPELVVEGCLAAATNVVTRVVGGPPNGLGLFVAGRTTVDVPLYGGQLHAGPIYLIVQAHALDAMGEYEVQAPISAAAAGQSFTVQAGYFDPFAPQGVALTNALELTVR